MKVRVRLFAGLRDAIGAREVAVELADGASVGELKARLGETYPAVRAMLERVVCAIDDDYVSADETVREGAEVALIPPVSGGATALEKNDKAVPRALSEGDSPWRELWGMMRSQRP